MILLLSLTVLPAFLLGGYIYVVDKKDKEPPLLLIKLIIGGIGAFFLTLVIVESLRLINPIFVSTETDFFTLLINNFIRAAFVEEFSKFIFLYAATWKNKNFNYLFDGIVYATFISIGFATVENFLYVYGVEGGFLTALLRGFLAVPGHMFFGVFSGVYYGLARRNKNKKKKYGHYLLLSFVVPWLVHGIYDLWLTYESRVIAAVYILFMISLYFISYRIIMNVSKHDKAI